MFADKWPGTAYQFYGVKLGSEPAGNLDRAAFVRRMFSDASCGAAQWFTYEFEAHAPEGEATRWGRADSHPAANPVAP